MVAAVAAPAVTELGVVVRSGAVAAARALTSVDGDCAAGVGSAVRGTAVVADPAGAAIASAADANGPPLPDNEARGGGRRSALATVTRSAAARVRT